MNHITYRKSLWKMKLRACIKYTCTWIWQNTLSVLQNIRMPYAFCYRNTKLNHKIMKPSVQEQGKSRKLPWWADDTDHYGIIPGLHICIYKVTHLNLFRFRNWELFEDFAPGGSLPYPQPPQHKRLLHDCLHRGWATGGCSQGFDVIVTYPWYSPLATLSQSQCKNAVIKTRSFTAE